jgi:hypothetical protein
MVDAMQRAKWMVTVAKEMGFEAAVGQMILGTGSSAAKSFVSRRGLGKMRHIEVRELWLQQEVLKGAVKVIKVPGESNPADLMTKFLHRKDIDSRLKEMGLHMTEGNPVKVDRTPKTVEMNSRKWADAREAEDEDAECAEVVEWWRGEMTKYGHAREALAEGGC